MKPRIFDNIGKIYLRFAARAGVDTLVAIFACACPSFPPTAKGETARFVII
jgi:hypothetical protein